MSYHAQIAAVLSQFHPEGASESEQAESDRFYLDAIGTSLDELNARMEAVGSPEQVERELQNLADVFKAYGIEAGRIPNDGSCPPDETPI